MVHGKGTGILKKAVHDYLKTDRRVLEYKTNNYNDGETILDHYYDFVKDPIVALSFMTFGDEDVKSYSVNDLIVNLKYEQ